jgi:FAD synthase
MIYMEVFDVLHRGHLSFTDTDITLYSQSHLSLCVMYFNILMSE